MNIVILGAGGWGIALAMKAYNNGNNVTLWSKFDSEVSELLDIRESKRLLPGIKIPHGINITTDLSCAQNSDIIVLAVPSVVIRETIKKLDLLNKKAVIVIASKGLEDGSLKRLSEVVCEVLPEHKVAVLSGPSHAEEVARSVPTSIVVATKDKEACERVTKAFAGDSLRIYSNNDIVGAELGGALKNIIAVASGFCDGMSLGDNTRAALITRGLTEIARLGVAMGADERTFAGLTGLGDLVVTCTSRHSRNHRFGFLVGSGTDIKTALEQVGTVEGYYATKMAHELSKKMHVEMPIVGKCYSVLYENKDVKDAVKELMSRPMREEHEKLWIK